MKCKSCGGTAVISMRHHKLALCKDHFLKWFQDYTQRTIRKFGLLDPGEKVLVAVSGGKDSLALWDALTRLGYSADGLYLDLGIDGQIAYSHRSREYAEKFATERGLVLHVSEAAHETGKTVPELIRSRVHLRGKPCSICGTVKRHLFDQAARERGFQTIATGHNLDDEAAVLFWNTLDWKTEQLSRQHPHLPARGTLPKKIKPLCRFYERETAAYVLLSRIGYIEEECPFAIGSKTNQTKTWLNTLEEQYPGFKLNYYLRFLSTKKTGYLHFEDSRTVELQPCSRCGTPTTSAEMCSYCRLVEV